MAKQKKTKETETPEEVVAQVETETPEEVVGAPESSGGGVDDVKGEEPKVESPWKMLPLLSDDDVVVEGCNVSSISKQCCLLRYRVAGEILPVIKVVDNYQVKIFNKIWTLR